MDVLHLVDNLLINAPQLGKKEAPMNLELKPSPASVIKTSSETGGQVTFLEVNGNKDRISGSLNQEARNLIPQAWPKDKSTIQLKRPPEWPANHLHHSSTSTGPQTISFVNLVDSAVETIRKVPQTAPIVMQNVITSASNYAHKTAGAIGSEAATASASTIAFVDLVENAVDTAVETIRKVPQTAPIVMQNVLTAASNYAHLTAASNYAHVTKVLEVFGPVRPPLAATVPTAVTTTETVPSFADPTSPASRSLATTSFLAPPSPIIVLVDIVDSKGKQSSTAKSMPAAKELNGATAKVASALETVNKPADTAVIADVVRPATIKTKSAKTKTLEVIKATGGDDDNDSRRRGLKEKVKGRSKKKPGKSKVRGKGKGSGSVAPKDGDSTDDLEASAAYSAGDAANGMPAIGDTSGEGEESGDSSTVWTVDDKAIDDAAGALARYD